jgi:hypothetical protein
VIPADAQRQSNWGQPPAGWGTPAPPTAEPATTTPTAFAEPVASPPPAEPALPTPATEPAEPALPTPAAEPAEPALPTPAAEPAAPVAEPPAPVAPIGLPDPANRSPHEDQWATRTTDQWAAPVSSLDWRTPQRPIAPPTTPPTSEPEVDPIGGEPVATRSGLPSRTPQRLARSTEPARTPLDWKPQRLAAAPMGGAPPPPEPDPETGEVPSDQYRTWLREWLAFAESYDG